MTSKAEKLLKDKKTKEWFMIGGTHTVVPLKDYRFAKFRIDFNEDGKDKFLFIVLEKNKFKKALLDNCREYRIYEIKRNGFVEESKIKKRYFRQCPNGCKDGEIEIIEKPNARLYDPQDEISWIFQDIWKCKNCKEMWLVTSHPETGDSFEKVTFLKKEGTKRVYKTSKGNVSFDKSPSKL